MEFKYCIAGKNLIAINAVSILLQLNIKKENIFACYNRTDEGKNGWQPSFKDYCRRQKIQSVTLEDLYLIEDLYFFSLEFDQLINVHKFRTQKLFNVHFSLLPKYKGMYTSIFPVLNSEKETGVTLHEIDNGIDTGAIIDQIKFDVGDSTSFDLYKKYIENGTFIFKKKIENLLNGCFDSVQQANENSTYFSRTSIDFGKTQIPINKTAYEIKCWVKAFSFRPFQMSTYQSTAIAFAKIENQRSLAKSGQVIEENYFFIKISTIDFNLRLYKDRINEILDAVRKNNVDFVREILKHGYNINDWGENGWTPLMVAAYFGTFEIIKLLVQNGADVNAVNFNGTSVLMYAMTNVSKTNDMKILDFLFSNGCNVNHMDYRDKSVYEYALEYGNLHVIELIKGKLYDTFS
jgi:methionyl-tRNA formyltransferase